MRVIAGEARGRRLEEPRDQQVRPTTDKVKEALFSAIQFELEGRSVLDLFAGTGQLGIEALSRGAAKAVFVDQSPDSIKLVQHNVGVCGFEERARIVRAESIAYLKSGEKYDIILIDPPYASNLAEIAVKTIIQFDILKDNGIIVVESGSAFPFADENGSYYLRREYRYGKINVVLLSRRPRT